MRKEYLIITIIMCLIISMGLLSMNKADTISELRDGSITLVKEDPLPRGFFPQREEYYTDEIMEKYYPHLVKK